MLILLGAAFEVPIGAVGLVERAAFEEAEAGATVGGFRFGPFPGIAAEVEDSEGGLALGVMGDGGGVLGSGAVVTVVWLHGVAPGVGELLGALGGVLPFGFGGEPFMGPGGVGASVFETDVGDGVVKFRCCGVAVAPVFEEVGWVRGLVARLFKESGELGVGDGGDIDGVGGESDCAGEVLEGGDVATGELVVWGRGGLVEAAFADAEGGMEFDGGGGDSGCIGWGCGVESGGFGDGGSGG
ncbi:MAG: hypothetical protein RI897_4125 [Verrucomicrobiota bacterium]